MPERSLEDLYRTTVLMCEECGEPILGAAISSGLVDARHYQCWDDDE